MPIEATTEERPATERSHPLRATASPSGTATARPKRETWLDWLPPGAPEPPGLLTREELLAELQRRGVSVSVDDIRNWQRGRIIPYGVRRWHGGAMRTLYPVDMADIIADLRARQRAGESLAEIAPRLRMLGRSVLASIRASSATATGNVVTATVGGAGSAAAVPGDVRTRLVEWAADFAHEFGARIARVDVSLVDEYDHPLTFRVAIGDQTSRGPTE